MVFHPWAVRLSLTSQRKCLNQQRISRKSPLRAPSARISWGKTAVLGRTDGATILFIAEVVESQFHTACGFSVRLKKSGVKVSVLARVCQLGSNKADASGGYTVYRVADA